MKYQKARLLEHIANPSFLWGKEMWVKIGRPEQRFTVSRFSGTTGFDLILVTAYTDDNDAAEIVTRADCVELLPEFQDDMPTLPFSQWMKENGVDQEKFS